MSKNDTWYGFLEAGQKSSPVVRDLTLEDAGQKTILLYNHVRGTFVEYAREIVEPKLRELKPGEISIDELDVAFNAAQSSFNRIKKAKSWNVVTPVPTAKSDDDDSDIDLDMDDDVDDFIDDDD